MWYKKCLTKKLKEQCGEQNQEQSKKMPWPIGLMSVYCIAKRGTGNQTWKNKHNMPTNPATKNYEQEINIGNPDINYKVYVIDIPTH